MNEKPNMTEAGSSLSDSSNELLGLKVELVQQNERYTIEEWEKAARGVDGRIYVWGNAFTGNGNYTLTKYNQTGKALFQFLAPPGSFPLDVSVYGAYDMAGNVREMTCSLLPNSETFYQIKGGSAFTPPNYLPSSYSSDTPVVPTDVGFRNIQEIPEKQMKPGGRNEA